MKKGYLAGAVICWILTVSWITFLVTLDNNNRITVDLSGIQTEELAPGNFTDESVTFQDSSSVIDFTSRAYDVVLISVNGVEEIKYQGKSGDNYHQTSDTPKLGVQGTTQKISKIELVNRDQKLMVYYAKNWCAVWWFSFLIAVFLAGILGGSLFSQARKKATN